MELLAPEQAAAYLKVSVHTLAAWRSKGDGPKYIKTGKSVKYAKEDLTMYLKKQTVNPKK